MRTAKRHYFNLWLQNQSSFQSQDNVTSPTLIVYTGDRFEDILTCYKNSLRDISLGLYCNIGRQTLHVHNMANEEAKHRCVTKFMLDTCRYSTSEYAMDIRFLRFVAKTAINCTPFGAEVFMSGSSAELRVKPMLSCIGDIDIMSTIYNFVAIPNGYLPPIELPDNYDHNVCACDIIDSHQPGYVYLQPLYLLRKTDDGRYLAEKVTDENKKKDYVFARGVDDVTPEKHAADGQRYLRLFMNQEIYQNAAIQSVMAIVAELHGPAVKATYNSTTNELLNKSTHRTFLLSGVDYVAFLRCFDWPPQASDWPMRKRDHCWPDATTINTVVSNGCDVVPAVHPLCKQDEWMSKNQWRLSFSRAEVTLLNSWTPVQQIIYHVLRFVMKREVVANDPNLSKLSNYHIKTLMMWGCEQKPQSWWSAESSLIKLCSSLLHRLSDWVADKRCQHYFISNCNLLEHFVEDASLTIRNSLERLADESVLLAWFVDNYIRKCAECCPPEVSELFQDICSCEKLERAVHAVVDWRQKSLSKELYMEYYLSETGILSIVMIYRRDAAGIVMLMEEFQNFDMRLREYFITLTSLRVAYTISIHSLTADQLAILWTLLDIRDAAMGSMNIDENEYREHALIRRAITLARLNNLGSNALEMLCNEMSKAFLHCCIAYGQESAYYSVVRILLAALYFQSGHYRAVTNWCEELLNRISVDCDSLCSIGAECMPHIDENVDSVFGLVVFYEYVQRQALNTDVRQQQQSTLAFTTELLAHYLCLECPTVEKSKSSKLTKYQQHLCKLKQPLLCDVLLFKEMKMPLSSECAEIPAGNAMTNDANPASNSIDSSLLVTSLELVSLEKLITFRQVMVRELHSEQFPVLNEFEALYAYKCGLFEECLEMCRNHVNMLLRAGCARNQLYPIALPQFVSVLDGELVSLSGVIGILHPVLFLLMLQFPDYESISVLTLSLYLMVQCQKKLREDSLSDSLRVIRFVHDEMYPAAESEYFIDRIILKLAYRSLKLYIDDELSNIES